MKRILLIFAIIPMTLLAQQESPTKGDPARGQIYNQITGATPLGGMNSLQIQIYRCNEIRQKIQMQLDMQAAGSVGIYNMQALREAEKDRCSKKAMDDARSHIVRVRTEQERRWQDPSSWVSYPPEAIRKKHQGIVVVLATVDNDHNIVGASLGTSSGFSELDNAAVHGVLNHRLDRGPGVWRVPITFSLHPIN